MAWTDRLGGLIVYELVLRIARLRVERIGLNATAAAAGIDKSQLSRWLADGSARRELRADAFCRLANSLGVGRSWDGFPGEPVA